MTVLTDTDLKSLWQHGTFLRGDSASFASTFHHVFFFLFRFPSYCFLIACNFSFHSWFFNSNGGVIIDDKRLEIWSVLSSLMAIECYLNAEWKTERNGKRNEKENMQCYIHSLAYYIFTHFLCTNTTLSHWRCSRTIYLP